jgi:glutaconate CoA-transferase, subunit B
VITDKAVLEADPESGELMLSALYPGITVAQVAEGIGWSLRSRSRLAEVPIPSERELHLLREVLDPQRLYLKR